jgi:hypothetical protein
MMTLILLSLATALAQEPAPQAPAAEEAVEAAEASALPAYVYTTEAVTLARWQGSDTASAQLDAGRRIEVVLEDGDMVRVRSGTDFGWVSRDKLTAEAPEQP